MNLLQVAINAQNCYVKSYVYLSSKILEFEQSSRNNSKDWSSEPFNKRIFLFWFVFNINNARNKIKTMIWFTLLIFDKFNSSQQSKIK